MDAGWGMGSGGFVRTKDTDDYLAAGVNGRERNFAS